MDGLADAGRIATRETRREKGRGGVEVADGGFGGGAMGEEKDVRRRGGVAARSGVAGVAGRSARSRAARALRREERRDARTESR